MENSEAISRRSLMDKACFVVGMTLFWPVVSYRIAPGLLVPGYELPVSATYDVLGALGALLTVLFALALAVGLARRSRWGERVAAAVLASGLLTLGLLAVSAFLGGSQPFVDALVTVVSTAYVCLLAAGWASRAGAFAPRFAVLACALSLALNIVLVALVQAIPFPESLGRASRAALLVFLSGAVLVLWRPRQSQGGQEAQGPSDARRLLRAFKGSSLGWMFAVLVLYLLFTTVIRTVLSLGFDFEEPLYKSWLSKVILFLFALAMFVVALWMNRNAAPSDASVAFPWTVFILSCLAVLYFAIVFAGYAPALCHEIVFPSRLYAYFLLWVVALVLAFSCGCRADVAVCLLFLPALGALRLFGCLVAAVAPMVPAGGITPMVLYVTTAFAVTVATFLYLRAYFSERSVQGRAGMRGASDPGCVGGAAAMSATSAAAAAEARREICRRLGAEHGCTEREVEVLVLLSEGHGQKRIAEELFLSPNTIHSYAKSLYRKLDVHDRQEVIDLVRSAEGE